MGLCVEGDIVSKDSLHKFSLIEWTWSYKLEASVIACLQSAYRNLEFYLFIFVNPKTEKAALNFAFCSRFVNFTKVHDKKISATILSDIAISVFWSHFWIVKVWYMWSIIERHKVDIIPISVMNPAFFLNRVCLTLNITSKIYDFQSETTICTGPIIVLVVPSARKQTFYNKFPSRSHNYV